MSLKVYSLGHVFTQFMPEWPSTPSVNIDVLKFHAKDGMYELQWEGIMHRCTHMDAPLHVTENTGTINDYPLWRLFGTGVAINCPKDKWGLITPEDLENATPKIQEGDIVMINTGFHHKWADTDEYFAYGPGIGEDGAKWLVNKKDNTSHEVELMVFLRPKVTRTPEDAQDLMNEIYQKAPNVKKWKDELHPPQDPPPVKSPSAE